MRRSGVLLLVWLSYFLVQCGHNQPVELNKEEMSDLLLDITVADQILLQYPASERDSIREIITQSLLKIHDLDRSELDTNLYLYMSDFEVFGETIKLMADKTKTLKED